MTFLLLVWKLLRQEVGGDRRADLFPVSQRLLLFIASYTRSRKPLFPMSLCLWLFWAGSILAGSIAPIIIC